MSRPRLLGAPLALSLVIGRRELAAVVVQHALVYPQGLSFTVDVRCRDEKLLRAHWNLWRHDEDLSDEVLRFGVQFADGREATSIPGGFEDDEPDAFLRVRGASGQTNGRFINVWLWPLPDEDPFAFVCEWPAAGIALARADVETAMFADAVQAGD